MALLRIDDDGGGACPGDLGDLASRALSLEVFGGRHVAAEAEC